MIVSKRHFWEIFLTKFIFNIKSEISKTYLGYLWWILEPLLHVAVLYVVFDIFLQTGEPNFLTFLVCGQIPFMWFSRSVTNASASIISGRGLIIQVAIPKVIFPLLTVSQDLIKQSLVFASLFIILIWKGIDPSFAWFGLIPVVLVQLMLVISVAFLCSAIVPFVPDFRYLIASGMLLIMFGSGIFYSYKAVILEKHQDLFLMNPMANLINNYREVLLEGQPPDWQALFNIGLFSIILIALMVWIFNRNESVFAKAVIQ